MKKIDIKFLQQIPLFTGLSDEKLQKVRNIIVERSMNVGTSIIKEGEKGSEMFILLEGEVEISRLLLLKVAGQGMDQRDKSLTRLTANDYAFFGEMALFDEGSERSASVIAKTACTVAVISQDTFFKLSEEDNEIGYFVLRNIIKILCTRLDKSTKDVLKLATALSLALGR
jgi:CRP-like cAMP-binding protein